MDRLGVRSPYTRRERWIELGGSHGQIGREESI